MVNCTMYKYSVHARLIYGLRTNFIQAGICTTEQFSSVFPRCSTRAIPMINSHTTVNEKQSKWRKLRGVKPCTLLKCKWREIRSRKLYSLQKLSETAKNNKKCLTGPLLFNFHPFQKYRISKKLSARTTVVLNSVLGKIFHGISAS